MMLERQILDLAQWLLLATALWWVIGAGLWLSALRSDRRWLGRLATSVALPGSRQLAQAVLAMGLTALSACSPDTTTPTLVYLGEAPTPSSTTDLTATTLPATTLPATTLPATTLPATPLLPTSLPSPTPPPPSTGQTDAADPASNDAAPLLLTTAQHQVVTGDHLWAIAADHLTQSGMTPTNAEIARYWQTVISANAATIRSGDPDLIVPGEIVTLPPLG